MISCCELISICIFTWGFTSLSACHFHVFKLWIDFNLYFYVRIHKNGKSSGCSWVVVNWFQFVFLREDSQATTTPALIHSSCELISICIFTWGFTSKDETIYYVNTLWIDFNLYFYVRIHKWRTITAHSLEVVNWFQFVFLREDSQEWQWNWRAGQCCELISICIFTWGFTRNLQYNEIHN